MCGPYVVLSLAQPSQRLFLHLVPYQIFNYSYSYWVWPDSSPTFYFVPVNFCFFISLFKLHHFVISLSLISNIFFVFFDALRWIILDEKHVVDGYWTEPWMRDCFIKAFGNITFKSYVIFSLLIPNSFFQLLTFSTFKRLRVWFNSPDFPRNPSISSIS